MAYGDSEFGAPREALEDRAAAFEKFATDYLIKDEGKRLEDVQIDDILLFAAYPFSSKLQPSRMPDFVFREYHSEAGGADEGERGFKPTISVVLDKKEGTHRYGFTNLSVSLESGDGSVQGRGDFDISYKEADHSEYAELSSLKITTGGDVVVNDEDEGRMLSDSAVVIFLKQDETVLPDCFVQVGSDQDIDITALLPDSIFEEGVNQVDALKDFLHDEPVEREGVEFSLLAGDQVRMLRIDPEDPSKKRIIFDITIPLGLTSEMAKEKIEGLIGEGVLLDPIHYPAARNDRLVFIRTLETLGIKVETPGIETVGDRALKDATQ